MPDRTTLDHIQQSFRDALTALDKPGCLTIALDALQAGEVDIITLYEQVLAPALNSITDGEASKSLSIWREHVRSSILRSVIECCYPHVLQTLAREGIRLDKGKVAIVSPTDEYHELGARMGADFFTLAGYQTIFVGANTPKKDMIDGIAHELPDYVVINVVNYYNAFKVKPIVAEILMAAPGVRVLGGGYAFRKDPALAHQLGVASVIDSMADIRALQEVQP
jgi:MerR family transcriptional regulator, light-induced transcriptional regulator